MTTARNSILSKASLVGALAIGGGAFALGMGLFGEFSFNVLSGGGGYIAGLIFAAIPLTGVAWVVWVIWEARSGGSAWDEVGWYLAKRLWYVGIVTIGIAALLVGLGVP